MCAWQPTPQCAAPHRLSPSSCTSVEAWIRACTHAPLHVYVCVCICMCHIQHAACTDTHTSNNMYTYLCVYIMCTFVYICIHIYIYIYLLLAWIRDSATKAQARSAHAPHKVSPPLTTHDGVVHRRPVPCCLRRAIKCRLGRLSSIQTHVESEFIII